VYVYHAYMYPYMLPLYQYLLYYFYYSSMMDIDVYYNR